MASLHRDPRGKSPFWYCAYTLPNGKRVFRSTKQTDHTKAEEFRRGIDRASKHGADGNLTESRARALISEIVEHTLGEPLTFYSAEEWLRQWLDGKRKARATGTYLKYRRTIESFIESLGPTPTARESYARARQSKVEKWIDEMVPMTDKVIGQEMAIVTATRNAVDVRKWVASRLMPNEYGNQPGGVTINNQTNVMVVSEERLRHLQELRRKMIDGQKSD
jgi:hypothetical protein